MQEHFQPVPGIRNAAVFRAGRVISNKASFRQGNEAAVAQTPLHNTAVDHNRMDFPQFSPLMEKYLPNRHIHVELSCPQ